MTQFRRPPIGVDGQGLHACRKRVLSGKHTLADDIGDKRNERSNSIRVRAFQESDAGRVRKIYTQAMLYGSDTLGPANSPMSVAQSSQLRKPLALILYSTFIVGLVFLFYPPTRIPGLILAFGALIPFIAWKVVISIKFKNFVQEALEVDLLDPQKYYGTNPGGFWVAEVVEGEMKGLIVGCVGLNSKVDRDLRTAELKRMTVDPSYQKKGVGRQLMIVLIEHAKENGLSTINLSTSNFQTVAMHMYEGFGFSKGKQVWVTVNFMSFTVDKAYLQHYSLDL
ncbi:acyl-CoA N-acyltransferase [Pholiota conissans]|uniref:Acyl-CoA N-acyltransferase n=1 Tax=Pholiota conissans TaxID=109636 RepID=A0A9P6CUR3_9AGAR|nr:acyl-CoA N-acyltransferase [Pholiota conissans]